MLVTLLGIILFKTHYNVTVCMQIKDCAKKHCSVVSPLLILLSCHSLAFFAPHFLLQLSYVCIVSFIYLFSSAQQSSIIQSLNVHIFVIFVIYEGGYISVDTKVSL